MGKQTYSLDLYNGIEIINVCLGGLQILLGSISKQRKSVVYLQGFPTLDLAQSERR